MLGAVPQNATPFGRKVLSNLSTWKQQQFKLIPPVRNLGGSCWQVTLDRMKKAYQAVYSKGIFQGVNKENQLLFEAIAGSRRKEDPWTGYDWSKHWKVVPKSLQYRGVPGALEHLGLGKVVEGENVWKGNISPGSPLQLWYGMGKIGHSAIMERYIHGKNGEIIGLVYSDQWLDYKVVLKKGDQKIIGFHFRR
jgi:hypothetical protein